MIQDFKYLYSYGLKKAKYPRWFIVEEDNLFYQVKISYEPKTTLQEHLKVLFKNPSIIEESNKFSKYISHSKPNLELAMQQRLENAQKRNQLPDKFYMIEIDKLYAVLPSIQKFSEDLNLKKQDVINSTKGKGPYKLVRSYTFNGTWETEYHAE